MFLSFLCSWEGWDESHLLISSFEIWGLPECRWKLFIKFLRWLFGCLQILLTASQTTFTRDQYICKSWFHFYRMIFIQSICNLTFEKSALVWPPVDASVGVYSELYSSVQISVEGSYFSRNRSSQKICLSC